MSWRCFCGETNAATAVQCVCGEYKVTVDKELAVEFAREAAQRAARVSAEAKAAKPPAPRAPGRCPNCSFLISDTAAGCPRCKVFGSEQAVQRIDNSGQVTEPEPEAAKARPGWFDQSRFVIEVPAPGSLIGTFPAATLGSYVELWIGPALLAVGVIGALWFWLCFDPTVTTDNFAMFGESYGGMQVYNIGRLSYQHNGVIFFCFVALIGLIVLLLKSKSQSHAGVTDASTLDADMVDDPPDLILVPIIPIIVTIVVVVFCVVVVIQDFGGNSNSPRTGSEQTMQR